MRLASFLLLAACLAPPLEAQVSSSVATWIRLDAPPGGEAATAAFLTKALPGWTSDQWGNLTRTVGRGSPRRVVACALDYSSWAVSQITDQGYLRLRRSGPASHPLWDQFQEAQRLAVATATGRVLGVVAVPNGHFAALHTADTLALTADDLWVDIGASSRAEAERMGVALLDPVFPDRPLWTFGPYATGPAAGARAGCAAVAAAAAGTPSDGETTFVLSTQGSFGWIGLGAVLTRLGPVDRLAIVTPGSRQQAEAPLGGNLPRGLRALENKMPAAVVAYQPKVLWPGTPVESIDSTEALALHRWVANAAGISGGVAPVRLPVDTARHLPPRSDGYGDLEARFIALADAPGVSGHERPIRDQVLAALPRWARDLAVVDTAGNVVVAAGPERRAIALIAHMDEVGWEVDQIRPDGRITLTSRGGTSAQSWEGVPALLHFDEPGRPPLRGVFVPRDEGRTKLRRGLTAWFALDSAAMVRAGVRTGLSVTAWKRSERLGPFRITARGTDDRSGSAALLAAITSIDPAKLTRRVYFVWATREEIGLEGAWAFGLGVGPTLETVYSIDTFVSSDTPLESPHFAYAPLGAGPVLRGLDDASFAPRPARNRVIELARAAGIPLQIGTTRGGTDGSAISPWGPPNIGLSWPGRYSHGPAEVLDLRDVDALAKLVATIALAP